MTSDIIMIRCSAMTVASGVKSQMDNSGFLKINNAAARMNPIMTSITANVRASDLMRFNSPRPIALPIITEDTEDMAITTTLRYW